MLVLFTITGGYPSEDWYMLLQNRWEWSSTAPFLASGVVGDVLLDGMPLVPFGVSPVPPASSRLSTVVADPLESGLWSGGRWCLRAESPQIPDSVLESGISLLQNTEQRSRYGIFLRRKLPGSVAGAFSSSRDDSAGVSLLRLERNPFSVRGLFWKSGYSLQGGYAGGPIRVAGGFSRLGHGDRRPTILGEFTTYPGRVFLAAGLGAAWTDPEVYWRGAIMTGVSIDRVILTLHGDITDSSNVVSAGLSLPGALSAGVSMPDSGAAGGFMTGGIGAMQLSARVGDANRTALSMGVRNGFVRGMGAASWDFDTDSLSLCAWALPGLNWYRARIEAGARVAAGMDSAGEWRGALDALAGFTLRTFSFALALEDVTTPENRSWTFGVTWSFSDSPPDLPEEEEEEGPR